MKSCEPGTSWELKSWPGSPYCYHAWCMDGWTDSGSRRRQRCHMPHTIHNILQMLRLRCGDRGDSDDDDWGACKVDSCLLAQDKRWKRWDACDVSRDWHRDEFIVDWDEKGEYRWLGWLGWLEDEEMICFSEFGPYPLRRFCVHCGPLHKTIIYF